MPETTTAPKCRACIEQGIPGECADPAHQVAPEIGDLPPPPPKWSDPGYLARAAEQHRATAAPEQPPAHQSGRTCQEPEGRDVPDLVRRVHDRVTEQRIPAFPGREPQEWHVHAEHAYSGDCAWCRHDHEIARLALVQAIVEAADAERVTEPPTDLRDAIGRAAGLAIAQCHDDGPLTWHPCGQCQGTPCACSGEPFSAVVADAVLPAVQAHVAAEVERARAEGAAGALRDAADAYEALSRNVLAATAFADQHYRAGGPTVPTLWLRHRADEVAAGGEQRG